MYQSWRTDHGLPSNDVRDVVQTRDGYIWVATVKGLSRFDGAMFQTYSSANTPQFSRDIVSQLCEDNDGVLWIAIEAGGLLTYKDGHFDVRSLPADLRTAVIHRLYLDHGGRLWIVANGNVYVRDGEKFERIEGLQGGVTDLAQDIYGDIVVVGSSVQLITGGGVRQVRLHPEIRETIGRIGVESDGTLLFSGANALYHVTPSSSSERWKMKKYDFQRRVNMILEEAPSSLLITSYGKGVERFADGMLSSIRGLESLQGATLTGRTMSRDAEGGIWVGTGGGLLRLKQAFVWIIGESDKLPDPHVWSVYRATDGTIWAGTETGTVTLSRGIVKTRLRKKDGMPADRIMALREMSDGSFWFGGHPDGLVRRMGGKFEDLSHFPGYRGGSVRALFEDHRRRVWVGTTTGLYRFEGSRFVGYPAVSKRATARVNSIQEDRHGDLWICAGTILRMHGDSISVFRPAAGAGEFPAWSMNVDSDRVWFGTYGSGLHLIQGDSIVSFERYTKDLGPDILSIMEDGAGELWLNAEHELQCVKKQDALDVASGKRTHLNVRVYGALDGLTDIEFNGTGQHSAAVAADGSFLYASMNGLVVVNPKETPVSSHMPPVRIQRFAADGKDNPVSGFVELPAGTKKIDIEFSALTYESISKVKFRYRLEGIDENWIELTSFNRNVSYANLNPGHYKFQVLASNAYGLWNTQGATLSFSVLPYFYERPVVQIFGLLLTIFLGVLGYRWRMSAVRLRQLTLEKAVDEKTVALQEEIETRKKTEEELRAIQGNLELGVEERTAQLSSAVENLRRSREQYQKIVDTAQEGIWMTDAREKTVFVNPKMTEILGASFEELIGSDLGEFLDEEGRAILAEKQSLHHKGVADRYELDFVQKNGSRISAVISSSPIFDDEGTYQGSLAMIADVTAQKGMERERQRVQEELRQAQKMEVVGQLAGGVAHDFNNLLIPILGYAEMLQKELKNSEKSLRWVGVIRSAGEKAALLTRQLLSFSRKQMMEMKPVDLNDIVSELSPMLLRMIREDVRIVYKLGAGIRVIKGDPSQLDQILINLLVNAQDAMPNGGTVSVETSNADIDGSTFVSHAALTAGHYVSLVVTDSGIGIAPEVLEHIFEPFFTTKDKRKGTGLGLATVYGIVKQHGGDIWVYSEPGSGTTFKIYFPTDPDTVQTVVEDARAPEEDLRGTETIVVAEDNDLARQLVRTILKDNGYIVYDAPEAEETVALFEKYGRRIDLLLTDVVMPSMNGRELFTLLSARYPNLKVVYMSGHSEEVISHRGILEAGVSFIQKPFTSEKLLKKIREAFATS